MDYMNTITDVKWPHSGVACQVLCMCIGSIKLYTCVAAVWIWGQQQ